MSEFTGKIVAVLGLARSGLAAAKVLTELGATVRLYDQKPESELTKGIAAARALGIEPRTGGTPVDYDELDLFVTSPGVRKDASVLQDALAAGVEVIGEIEAAYRVARAPILAITGTNGKTTTTVLVAEMIKASGRKAYVAGNIAAGEIAMPLIHAAHIALPNEAIVAEISSFQLEWITRFQPKVAALLNISPDHGDRQTWDEYVAAKWRIFENQTPDDVAVINDNLIVDPDHRVIEARIELFGSDNAAEILAAICPLSEVKLPGRHNIENLAAAALMARAFGVGDAAIREVASTFTGVVHRLEYVRTLDGVRYINNSMCTNVDAFQRSLEALPEPKIVIVGGVFKGGDLSPIGASVANDNVRGVVVIGKSGPEIAAAIRAAGFENVRPAETMEEAVHIARSLAISGDTVILAPACASFDMFKDFEDRGDRFKAAVKALDLII